MKEGCGIRWTGTAWKHVTSVNLGSADELLGVASTSTGDAWAVGQYENGDNTWTLIERWNGSAWK